MRHLLGQEVETRTQYYNGLLLVDIANHHIYMELQTVDLTRALQIVAMRSAAPVDLRPVLRLRSS